MTDNEPTIIFGDTDIGTVFDGTLGWHIGPRIIHLAAHCDFVFPHDGDKEAVLRYAIDGVGNASDFDVVIELCDEAIEYLQKCTAPGLQWIWDDGVVIVSDCEVADEPKSKEECEHCIRTR